MFKHKMASISFGTRSLTKTVDVVGYVHKVSEVTTSRKSVTDSSTLNTRKCLRIHHSCLFFSKDPRHSELVKKEPSKEPARLLNVSAEKRKYDLDTNEYVINKYSRSIIWTVKVWLTFPWKSPSTNTSTVLINDILDGKIKYGKLVTVKGKLIFKPEIQTVFFKHPQRGKKSAELLLQMAMPQFSWTLSTKLQTMNRTYFQILEWIFSKWDIWIAHTQKNQTLTFVN